MAKKENTASVLAFEKKLVPSDGYMYGCQWDNKSEAAPLSLNEKSVRGTISNRLKPALQKDPAALNNEVEKPNLQTVDACSLGTEQDTLKLHFTLKVLGGLKQPSACNNAAFKEGYQQAVSSYLETQGMRELAKRYALNIANARFLWRNRFGAEAILVQVKALNKGAEQSWEFDALELNPRDMEVTTADVESLADRIASALSSDNDFLMLDITCYAKVGKAQDVYPSEELVLDKGKGNKSKILYSVDGMAAMHSQKLGNAMRTIDTWYPEHDDAVASAGPIAIEPYGAVTNLGKAFRTPADKQDFYTFFDSWARGGELARVEDEHYVMGVLVRGGVFGESDK
ncbi:CRISPR type I-F/YPEST-associated protein Csy3 [Methylophaga frappieri]|uniref:CRISPR type I-F/YPEST-associated protein Csy3 n=1 Tax=Methylophaga frappieri (strain ATCC BAA-2434 / DSM 25690 / JAM7) TaxID=754477 RepID=I1YH07_METFJ|nr:type I-F CRISPR-associated protein Csy3 [Methylophaga frappieri]AFJ02200.1 CRISPR type I-F/YPEST-associated protein Csy3 [Methylophaga frappieri]